ncbi:hypothetical protein ACSSS7_006449 [Eimeria intestinalis]
MAPLLGISAACSLAIALCSSLHALANQAHVSEDIVLNGASEQPPPAGYNPFLAKLHVRNGGFVPSPSVNSLTQQDANASDHQATSSSAATALQEELTNAEGGLSALQTSEDSAECSCVFAGRCLYKGACLWVAASLAFCVILLLFLMAWALQWMVAIPAEWILAKKQIKEKLYKTKTGGSPPSDVAPLLKS